ncbi:hypothetical protein JCM19237_4658 [Photobacterium aphoticum]|uniref:Uncharacterized protein n=1 Tax=Photobacterium aphoticum TaxID=754436 RepID=A0A090RI81_9GAMM|nr:hypothetical protein JCM19237_4658 [Photobacterium aphoticum]
MCRVLSIVSYFFDAPFWLIIILAVAGFMFGVFSSVKAFERNA